MQKLKDGVLRQIKKHRVGLACFLFLVLYEWLIANNGAMWSVNPVTYSLYALDYSMGFCTRILPGAVYGALVGKYEYLPVSIFVSVFFLLLLGFLSFFMERFFEAAAPGERKTCLVLLFFFLTGPFTFGGLVHAFGFLDQYWILFFAAGLLLLRKKHLKWLLPLCFAGMIFIHFAALFCYAAVLLLLLLFFAAKTEDRKEKRQYYLLFAVCFVVTVGFSGYFIQFESENTVLPVEEFNEILRERNVIFPEYLDSTLYRMTDSSIATPTYTYDRYTVDPSSTGLVRFIQWILYYVWAAFSFTHEYPRLLFLLLLELPAAAFLLALLISYFKANKGQKEKKIISLLMILLFFGTTAVGFLFSSDTVRWMDHAFIDLFICTFAALYYDYRAGFAVARKLLQKVGLPPLAVYALAYGLITMDPYQ